MFSIIIPTCNRNDLLAKCLDLLSPDVQTTKSYFEVIVTDDSKDNLAKCFVEQNYSWAKWVEGTKCGPAANRNNGAKYANGDWLAFIDDDCLPDSKWLLVYQNAVDSYLSIKVFEGYTNAERPKQRYDEEAPINTGGNRLWSCNFAIKKSFFNELGGFDETFPFAAMEDIDFYIRVKKHSSIQFLEDAIVIHPWRRLTAFKNVYKHIRSHRHFAQKYKLTSSWSFRWSRIKIFIGSIVPEFIALIKFSMKGSFVYIEKMALNFLLIFI